MIRESLAPGKHKLAVAASLLIVAVLTAIGVWTGKTAERQTTVEHKIEVQHTEVVQALCEKPFTRKCAHHAVNVVRTCVAIPRCVRLLASATVPAARTVPETSNSSSGNTSIPNFSPQTHPSAAGTGGSTGGSPSHGGGPPGGGKHGGGGGGGKGHSSPPPPPAPPAPPPPVLNPAGHEPPGLQPGHQGNGHTNGLVPGATEAIEGTVECVGRLDLPCASEQILGPSGAGN